jgi:phenylpropionate dioxygenase-like ring-hydroxylating dioxygenase large terminal subunit
MTSDHPAPAKPKGLTYQQILDTDTHPVPEVLRRTSDTRFTNADVPITRYTTREFHELEKETLWSRVWQMVCRSEDISEIGDTLRYDIADRSYLIVRTANNTIKGYYNACLHRGRMLREYDGRVDELRCPFHGFCWALDGQLKQVPSGWDFAHVFERADEFQLPEVNVDTWGGFVFINPDEKCEPLASFLGELIEHFATWDLENRYKSVHVAKIIRCNWKIASEAFSEALHVIATHPQILPSIGDANTQYDVWGNFSRAISPNNTPSPNLNWIPTEQQMFDVRTDRQLGDNPVSVIPEGMTARQFSADTGRETWRPVVGDRVDKMCDAEFNDSFYYTVFPNFHPWGAFNAINYRFRPNGDDHQTCIMECMFLLPFPEGQRPSSVEVNWLGPDDQWAEHAPELGNLARVFDQDTFNLARVQEGLLAMKKPGVTLANYQELKVRHAQVLLEEWVYGD